MPSRKLCKGEVVKEPGQKRYYIAPNGFNARVLVTSHAGAASISSASACPGSKRRADGLGTGDARGVTEDGTGY